MKFNTALLHSPSGVDQGTGATLPPIYQSGAFLHKTAEELEAVFQNHAPGFSYSRVGNPTVDILERRIAGLEGGVGAVACASGMAAVSLAVLNILKAGDELVSSASVFGGTISLFRQLADFGITVRYAGDSTPQAFAAQLTERTKLIFTETIGNPKLDVPDLRALARTAHEAGVPLIVDNTVATPFLARPIELGADLVVHSASKYINGSGNSIGGVIVDGGSFPWDAGRYPAMADFLRYGRFAFLARLRAGLFRNFGACMAPFNAFLCGLGLETLGIRMERICDNAQKLAEFLAGHPKVASANYPGLPESPWHRIAGEQFPGRYGGILTLRAGSRQKAFDLINRLKYAYNVANIGDSKTLVIHSASTIYAGNTLQERENAGVWDDLIRVSVGLEDIEDLIDDFGRAVGGI